MPTCNPTGPLDCSPSQVGNNYVCLDLPSNFNKQVTAAVQAVMAQNPSWFDTSMGSPCCPLCTQPNMFMDAVVAQIQTMGLCAARDPNDADHEIAVKLDNSCDEGFAVLTSSNIVRNPAKLTYTCVPAWL
jgi:hypothetical protein